MEESKHPFVSVIIPVFNDPTRLKLCLAALENQTYPQSHYEVIVIDNGSHKQQDIQKVVDQFGQAKMTEELTPGSYVARNKGIEVSKGEAIAFTDADCIPERDWLEQGIYHLQTTPNCGQVIGKIEIFFFNPQHPTSIELYESITAFPQQRLLQQFHAGATANVFTWREVINRVGKFDTQLKSNGDLEWGSRVYAQGYQQVYSELALVHHPARRTWQELCTRTQRLAGGNYNLKLKPARSVWQRQIIFLRILLQNLIPPVLFGINTFLLAGSLDIGQKLKVSSVMVFVRYITAWETLRLKLGALPNRG